MKIVLHGKNLMKLHPDIQRRHAAGFRAFRPDVWKLPAGDEPVISSVEFRAEAADVPSGMERLHAE